MRRALRHVLRTSVLAESLHLNFGLVTFLSGVTIVAI
jgi:hypothetical protein